MSSVLRVCVCVCVCVCLCMCVCVCVHRWRGIRLAAQGLLY